MQFGPVEITAKDIKSFAERFDPQPMHLGEGDEQNTVVTAMFASGLRTICQRPRAGP